VLPTLTDGTPLCQLPELARPAARLPQAVEAPRRQPQADRINALAHERGEPWIGPVRRQDLLRVAVRQGTAAARGGPGGLRPADRWIEAADWIIWQLCGVETRNACTAGYKGIYQDGATRPPEFLAALNPGFADFAATSWSIRSPRSAPGRAA
jgi:L-ribulokinase